MPGRMDDPLDKDIQNTGDMHYMVYVLHGVVINCVYYSWT